MREYKQLCVGLLLSVFLSLNLALFFTTVQVQESSEDEIYSACDYVDSHKHYHKSMLSKVKHVIDYTLVNDIESFAPILAVICVVYVMNKVCPRKQIRSYLHTRAPPIEYLN